jgi:hypothetical protein
MKMGEEAMVEVEEEVKRNKTKQNQTLGHPCM